MSFSTLKFAAAPFLLLLIQGVPAVIIEFYNGPGCTGAITYDYSNYNSSRTIGSCQHFYGQGGRVDPSLYNSIKSAKLIVEPNDVYSNFAADLYAYEDCGSQPVEISTAEECTDVSSRVKSFQITALPLGPLTKGTGANAGRSRGYGGAASNSWKPGASNGGGYRSGGYDGAASSNRVAGASNGNEYLSAKGQYDSPDLSSWSEEADDEVGDFVVFAGMEADGEPYPDDSDLGFEDGSQLDYTPEYNMYKDNMYSTPKTNSKLWRRADKSARGPADAPPPGPPVPPHGPPNLANRLPSRPNPKSYPSGSESTADMYGSPEEMDSSYYDSATQMYDPNSSDSYYDLGDDGLDLGYPAEEYSNYNDDFGYSSYGDTDPMYNDYIDDSADSEGMMDSGAYDAADTIQAVADDATSDIPLDYLTAQDISVVDEDGDNSADGIQINTAFSSPDGTVSGYKETTVEDGDYDMGLNDLYGDYEDDSTDVYFPPAATTAGSAAWSEDPDSSYGLDDLYANEDAAYGSDYGYGVDDLYDDEDYAYGSTAGYGPDDIYTDEEAAYIASSQYDPYYSASDMYAGGGAGYSDEAAIGGSSGATESYADARAQGYDLEDDMSSMSSMSPPSSPGYGNRYGYGGSVLGGSSGYRRPVSASA